MAYGRSGSRTIGYVVGAIVLLLLLAWFFGLFGAGDVAELERDGIDLTEEGAAVGEAVGNAAEATGEAIQNGAAAIEGAVEDAIE